MGEAITEAKNIVKNELFDQYNWFHQTFLPAIQTAGDEFFSDIFSFHFVSLSKNINALFQGDEYFVTKILIDKQHDVYIRCSSAAVGLILEKTLGQTKKFNVSNITDLEGKIISSFNEYLYNAVSRFLLPPPPKNQKRKNFDIVNLTLFVADKETGKGAKVILSLPHVLLAPQVHENPNEVFDALDFKTSKIDVKIKVGNTKFPLKEIKNLEKEDLVIFDNSNIHLMTVVYKDMEKQFKIIPNPGLILSIDNDGGHNMSGTSLSQNLWDNIQVEMGAEFEKVKITLGELKNIEQGVVLDISSLYNNKVSLKVEDKIIANGELVIVNDRYGVRIGEVFASDKTQPMPQAVAPQQEAPITAEVPPPPEHAGGPTPQTAGEIPATAGGEDDDEFNYSDFELDDQDI